MQVPTPLHVYVPAYARYKLSVDLASALARSVPGLRVSGSSPDLCAAARDLWPRALVDIQSGTLPANRPGAVVWPERPEQISRLIELGRSQGFRVVPFGAGSGVCGGVLPDERTVVVDSKRLLDFRVDRRAAGETWLHRRSLSFEYHLFHGWRLGGRARRRTMFQPLRQDRGHGGRPGLRPR